MGVGVWILIGFTGLATLAWLAMYSTSLVKIPAARRLRQWAHPDALARERWPKLSVIVPARDEAQTIEPALRSLLATDYPDLEIIVVDDRSADGTGDLARRIAGDDARVRVLRIDTLPDGWLGKVNALEVGRQAASGELLLLTDADIVFESPDVLRRAVGTMEADALDQLCLGPHMLTRGLLHAVMCDTFILALLWQMDGDKVEDPESDAFVGAGAFNMVRRSAFERTPGFEWLRLEIAEDMGVGLMLKQAGARCRPGLAYDDLSVRWYDGPAAMVRGLEKNSFPAFSRFSFTRALAFMVSWTIVLAGPPLALALQVPYVVYGAAAALTLQLVFSVAIARVHQRPLLPVLLHPLGQWIMLYIFARSTWRYFRERACTWRETRYEIDELREHQRVKV